MSQPSASVSISQIPATTSSLDIERIFDIALKSYKKKTKNDLKNHDLFKQLEACDSPAAILAVFQAARFDFSPTASDDRFKKWLVPTINVLYAFSGTLSEGVALVNIDSSVSEHDLMSIRQVFSPAKLVFAGVGVLLLVTCFVSSLVWALLVLIVLRQQKMLLRVKTSSSISSDASKASSSDSRSILRSR